MVKTDGWLGGFTRLPIAIDSQVVAGWGANFNLAQKDQADLWVHYHNQLTDQGVDFWWIDGECAQMDGLNSELWTCKVYYDGQEKHTGQRSFIFSRYGGPGSHRYPGFFTGDNYSNWHVLASEIPFTLKAGNAFSPYVTHDISGFCGTLADNFELYARWVQFGAFDQCCVCTARKRTRSPLIRACRGFMGRRDATLHGRSSSSDTALFRICIPIRAQPMIRACR